MPVQGVWGYPSRAGADRDSICRYLDKVRDAGINAIFMHVKGGDGLLYWPSALFPECRAEPYASVDFPALLLEEAGPRGIELHAWFIDFMECPSSAVVGKHPEWTMRDPHGKTTAEEILRGKPFGMTWMCPAQRPGYTDQWLVPIYKEFAAMYDWAGVHHDYIRYPGDVAPDRYCFCDFCLEQIPRWAGYYYESAPNEQFYHELYDRGYLEAHWEQGPRVLPANWDRLDRASKARFLLEGSFFQGGRSDLDTFFYGYRIEAIARFARESAEAVRAAKPGMKISGAVFKNPVHSGRFIGQDWRRFEGYLDWAIPMDYRDHFPGSFETYLDLLAETIRRQKEWAEQCEKLCIGIAVNFLFKEEPGGPYPEAKLRQAIQRIREAGSEDVVLFCDDQLDTYGMWNAVRAEFASG